MWYYENISGDTTNKKKTNDKKKGINQKNIIIFSIDVKSRVNNEKGEEINERSSFITNGVFVVRRRPIVLCEYTIRVKGRQLIKI